MSYCAVVNIHICSFADNVSKAIKDQRIKYLPVDKEEYTRIVIRRKHLWDDAMCHIKNLDERKHIRVTFVGEPAVDGGGPLREFFHLLTADIARKNMIFNGDDYRRVPRHCVMELENRTYYNVGKIPALSLMHGGPAPRFLARTVVDYIVYGSAQASPFDVPDQAIQESLIKVILTGNGCIILLYSGAPLFRTPLGQFKLAVLIKGGDLISGVILYIVLYM